MGREDMSAPVCGLGRFSPKVTTSFLDITHVHTAIFSHPIMNDGGQVPSCLI
jgi:hypothetical protein